jgi:multidrug resistance protein MdtO
MTVAATIVMLLVMTFRIPGGFHGTIFTLLISRENPTATLLSGVRTAVAYLIGTLYTVFTIRIMIGDPLTHFLWVGGSVFLSFYLLRVIADYGTAVPFGFAVLGAISLWDNSAIDVNTRVENTLWLAGGVAIAVAVTIVLEYVFRMIHPTTDLTEGIEARMQTVEDVLRWAAAGGARDSVVDKKLDLYSSVGTSRLRRLILRSRYSAPVKSQITAAIVMVGRLVDLSVSFCFALGARATTLDPIDRERCTRLADQIAVLRENLLLRQLPEKIPIPTQAEHSGLRFLPEMERTVAFIPQVLVGAAPVPGLIPVPMQDEPQQRMFVVDALSNFAYVQFALRGTLAAMVCYITYIAFDWAGLSTSVLTCFITALSTIGSSRQKQVLRFAGTCIGGFVFGMGAQIFVLPYVDSIVGFTVLFAFVTAISAWLQTASARLSYLGVQLALAFYLIHLQEFTIQTSLSIARDRVFGVLLGLVSMWLLYDRLWVRNALDEMQTVFARNLQMLAELAEQLVEKDTLKAIKRIRMLRDQINAGFQALAAQSDALLFEFGPERQRNLEIREDVRRWQPSIRTLLQLQIAISQYRAEKPVQQLLPSIAEAHIEFEQDIAQILRALANEVQGKPSDPAPDLQNAAQRLEKEIRNHYASLGVEVPSQGADMISLAESVASILSPLYQDIHITPLRPAGGPSTYNLNG